MWCSLDKISWLVCHWSFVLVCIRLPAENLLESWLCPCEFIKFAFVTPQPSYALVDLCLSCYTELLVVPLIIVPSLTRGSFADNFLLLQLFSFLYSKRHALFLPHDDFFDCEPNLYHLHYACLFKYTILWLDVKFWSSYHMKPDTPMLAHLPCFHLQIVMLIYFGVNIFVPLLDSILSLFFLSMKF